MAEKIIFIQVAVIILLMGVIAIYQQPAPQCPAIVQKPLVRPCTEYAAPMDELWLTQCNWTVYRF